MVVHAMPFLIATSALVGASNSQWLLMGIIVAATALSLISLRRKRAEGGPSPRTYVRELNARIKEEGAVKTDLTELMVQLQQVAREINAQLDTKFMKLERSISDADDRIARLQRTIRAADGEPMLDVTVSDDPAGQTIAPPRTSLSARRQQIFSLADTGESVVSIVAQMGVSVGEVDLILKLRKVQPKTPTPSEV